MAASLQPCLLGPWSAPGCILSSRTFCVQRTSEFTDAGTGRLLKDPHPHHAGYWTRCLHCSLFLCRPGSETGEGEALFPSRSLASQCPPADVTSQGFLLKPPVQSRVEKWIFLVTCTPSWGRTLHATQSGTEPAFWNIVTKQGLWEAGSIVSREWGAAVSRGRI